MIRISRKGHGHLPRSPTPVLTTMPFFLISSYGCQVSLALVVGTTLVIGMVENAKVVVISVVIAGKDVSD